MEPITWVFAVVAAVAVFVIAAVVVGREAHRLDAVAPRVVYHLDEAVEFVADRVPPATQARLTPAELEQLLVVPPPLAARQGPAARRRHRPPPGHRDADGDRRGHARRLPPRRVRARRASSCSTTSTPWPSSMPTSPTSTRSVPSARPLRATTSPISTPDRRLASCRGRSATMGGMGIEFVDFHFDVMCPWAYQTSRWMREVRDLTGSRGAVEVLQPRGDQPRRGQEAPVGAGVVVRLVDAAHRRPAAARRPGAPRRVVRAGRPSAARGGPPAAPSGGRRGAARRARPRPRPRRRGHRRPDDPRRRARRARARSSPPAAFGVPTLFFPDGQCLFGPVVVDPPPRRRGARAVGARAGLAAVPPAVRDPAAEGGAPTWR